MMAAPDTAPFLLRAGPTGCLLIHGFTATPEEMRFLGERLHARGYTVSGVRVAGHATSVDDLERSTWRDWYASAYTGLVELRQHAVRIIAVGQSMGALLALKLGADPRAGVEGLALLSPALKLSMSGLPWLTPIFPLILAVAGHRYRYLPKKNGRDIADPRARAASRNYPQLPLRGIAQLVKLQQQVRRLLPQVHQPALIIHARQDHTCPLVNVEILRRHLAGPVRTRLLDHSYHVVSVDVEKEEVADEVARFVEEVTAAPPAHPPSV